MVIRQEELAITIEVQAVREIKGYREAAHHLEALLYREVVRIHDHLALPLLDLALALPVQDLVVVDLEETKKNTKTLNL